MVVIEPPETQYARTSDGAHVAYQVCGDGPLDVLLLPLGVNHVELGWEVATFARSSSVWRPLAA